MCVGGGLRARSSSRSLPHTTLEALLLPHTTLTCSHAAVQRCARWPGSCAAAWLLLPEGRQAEALPLGSGYSETVAVRTRAVVACWWMLRAGRREEEGKWRARVLLLMLLLGLAELLTPQAVHCSQG